MHYSGGLQCQTGETWLDVVCHRTKRLDGATAWQGGVWAPNVESGRRQRCSPGSCRNAEIKHLYISAERHRWGGAPSSLFKAVETQPERRPARQAAERHGRGRSSVEEAPQELDTVATFGSSSDT